MGYKQGCIYSFSEQSLNLGKNKIKEIPEGLEKLPKLYIIDLSYNRLTYVSDNLLNRFRVLRRDLMGGDLVYNGTGNIILHENPLRI